MARYAVFDGTNDWASVPDAAGFSALGDFSVVVAVEMNDWTPGVITTLMSHQNATGNQRSWDFGVQTDGTLRLRKSTNGSTNNDSVSTAAPAFVNGVTYWVLVTRATGTGNVNFYTAPWTGSVTPPAIGSFTLLGSANVAGSTGALFNSTAALAIGAQSAGTLNFLAGKVYRSQLYSGIYGSGSEALLVDFDPTNDPANGTSTTWSEGTHTWTLSNGAHLGTFAVLGEVSEADTAQAIARAKAKTLGQASQTDTAQAFTRVKAKTLAEAAEADSAQALTRLRARTLGQVSEVDTAQPVTARKAKTIGQASEVDAAQAFTRVKSRTLGQATEADTAQAIARAKRLTIGQAEEIDTAQPITVSVPGEVTILVIGDSVAWHIAEALRAYGHNVLNGGLGGTGPGQENILLPTSPQNWHDSHFAGALIDYWNPDKVVIHFAGANWVWNATHTGIEQFDSARWRTLTSDGFVDVVTDDVMSRMAEADVVDVSGLPMGDGYGPEFGHGLSWMEAWVDANWTALWPSAGHVSLADLAVSDSRYRDPDTIHLTTGGGALVAARVADVLGISATPLPAADSDPVSDYVVTDRYRRAVSESHERVVKVEVLLAGTDDPIDLDLGLIDGVVSCDAQNVTQRTATLTVVDISGTLDAATAEQLLNPFTAELRISGGVRYPDGTEDVFPLGTLPVTELHIGEDSGALTFEMTLMDRSIRAQRPFGRPYVIAAGTALEVAIRDLIWTQAPLMPLDFPVTGYVTPQLILPESSTPWEEAAKLALLAGYTLHVNPVGVGVMSTYAVAASSVAQWRFEEGSRSTFWNPKKSLFGGLVANHIIVRSKSNAAIMGEAFDADPASPSYVGGPYRDQVKVVIDERVTTIEQAQRAAEALLVEELGPATVIPVESVPNAALELNATAKLTRTALGLDSFVLVDAFEYPLVADASMPVRLRRSILTEAPEQLRAVV